jgi:hypothetical protein
MLYPRRQFLVQSTTLVTALALPRSLRAESTSAINHPRLFLSATGVNGLQTVADFRQGIAAGGWLGTNWTKTLAQARAEAKLPPLQPDSPVPHRSATSVRDRNLDYYLCAATGSRLNRFALAHLVTGDEACLTAALAQLTAILDPDQWPDWIDQSHLRLGHPADLRTGMLSQDAGIAYDWLHHSLDQKERAFIREGIDRRGIQPFLTSVDQKAWWTSDLNNWISVIAGGVAIAAMSLHGEHPQAQHIIDYATGKFEDYLATYGPSGEFNESVGYSGANRIPVSYFLALRYATGGQINRLASFPFPEMCYWVRQATLDQKRGIPFGDAWPLQPVRTGYTAAVAAAIRDGGLQHYFLATQLEEDPHPMELLFFDARLKPISPSGLQPLAIAYPAHGGMIVSRTSWDNPLTDCIVFSKSGREENHEHNDLGQVGFNTLGERLIIDLGSPSSYPEDFFEPHSRWKYYNASVYGHNVLMFGGREQRYPVRARGEDHHIAHLAGKVTQWWHEAGQGTAWRMDLTPAYDGATLVTRTVLHLWPGYILVLDEAQLEKTEAISLRWHTIDQATPTAAGAFVVQNETTAATAQIVSLHADQPTFTRREHAYTAPYHLERSGDPLEQRHESFIEIETDASNCRLLTLFATGAKSAFSGQSSWEKSTAGWVFHGPHGPVEASVTATQLSLSCPTQHRTVTLPLTLTRS